MTCHDRDELVKALGALERAVKAIAALDDPPHDPLVYAESDEREHACYGDGEEVAMSTERETLKTRIAEFDNMLSRVSSTSLTRLSLEGVRRELVAELDSLTDLPQVRTARMEIAFSGEPIVDSVGMDTEFGADVLSALQKLVAALLAVAVKPEAM